MDDVTAKGLQLFEEIMGPKARAAMEDSMQNKGFASDIAKIACDYAFGSVWARDGLPRRDRSLVTIGVLIAQRQTLELKNHIRIGIANGLTVQEIEEALIQTIPYTGFPAVASATTVIIEVLREMGIDTTTPTSEEQGLL